MLRQPTKNEIETILLSYPRVLGADFELFRQPDGQIVIQTLTRYTHSTHLHRLTCFNEDIMIQYFETLYQRHHDS